MGPWAAAVVRRWWLRAMAVGGALRSGVGRVGRLAGASLRLRFGFGALVAAWAAAWLGFVDRLGAGVDR